MDLGASCGERLKTVVPDSLADDFEKQANHQVYESCVQVDNLTYRAQSATEKDRKSTKLGMTQFPQHPDRASEVDLIMFANLQ